MWLGFNSPRSKAILGTWDHRFEAYQKNLKSILPKLNSGARRFFQNALVLHDGTLTRMEVGDRIGDAEGKTTRGIANRRQLVVRLFVLSDRVDQHCYTLQYKNIDRVELNHPGKMKLFPVGTFSNLGDQLPMGCSGTKFCSLRVQPSSSIFGKFPSIENAPNSTLGLVERGNRTSQNGAQNHLSDNPCRFSRSTQHHPTR